jgi:hypothetical protein
MAGLPARPEANAVRARIDWRPQVAARTKKIHVDPLTARA